MEIKNIGQLIQHLATKAGVTAVDQNLINVLSSSEISKITVHSDLVKAIDENLLSVDSALDNHPKIKNHYNALALNAFDSKMEAIMKDAGLSEDKITELKGIKNTYQRFESLTGLLKEAAADDKTKVADDKTKTDKTALEKQVETLLKDLETAKKEHTNKLAEVESTAAKKIKDTLVQYELRSLFSSVKTIYDNLPLSAKQAAINSIVAQELQDKNVVFDFDENNNFVMRNQDGTAFIGANHQKFTPSGFIDEVLAKNKLIVVTPKKEEDNQETGGKTPRVLDARPAAPTGNNQAVSNLNRKIRESAEQP